MRNHFLYLFITFFITPVIWATNLQITAILPIFAQIAQDLGGEQVDVSLLSNTSSDPHYFQLTPKQHQQLYSSDLVIGPTEIIQRLPLSQNRLLDVSQAEHSLAVSQPDLQSLAAIVNGTAECQCSHSHDHHHDHSDNSLSSITHEWVSFSALRLLSDLLYQRLCENDPSNTQIYTQRYHDMIHGLDHLKKMYLNKELKKQSIFYHNDCWILEKELHVAFGPFLYTCEESGLSPDAKYLLEEKSMDYKSFIIDSSIPLNTIPRIIQLVKCPVEPFYSLGKTDGSSTVSWLADILDAIYK